MRHNVLFVDEDEILLFKLKNYFSKSSYVTFIVNNGEEALKVCKQHSISVVVTALHMKSMNGRELLLQLKEIENKPIVIIYSYDLDFQTATELIRLGAFDYVHKSANLEKLEQVIQKAIDTYEMTFLQKELEEQRALETQAYTLEDWKEIIQKKSQRETNLVLENLRTSLSQGSGFGSMISIIKRIQKKAEKENGYYKVPEHLMEILIENATVSERVIDLLKYGASIRDSVQLEQTPIKEIHGLLYDLSITKMQKYARLKDQRIILSENSLAQSTKSIWIDKKFFTKVIEELLFNAFKFSIPNSKIFILFEGTQNEFILEIFNSPEANQNGTKGIPDELSELVFEPFFRISKYVYPDYPTLDFGLGLTFTKEVVEQMKGKIKAKNIKSHLETEGDILTTFQIQFPFISLN